MSSLTVSSGGGTVTAGSLRVCPGTIVSLTCSHDSAMNLIENLGIVSAYYDKIVYRLPQNTAHW